MSEELSALFERYAAGLAREDELPSAEISGERRRLLVEALLRRGIKGWPERGTFYTRSLPPGCGPCLEGRGSNVALTTLCTRECFFCFNPKPRAPGLSVHGRAVDTDEQAAEVLEKRGIASVGLSGGEPLLEPERALSLLAALRRRLGPELRVDLYTNGDLLTPGLARRLAAAGLSGLRVNLAANGYDVRPVRVALAEMPGVDVEVELPVIPEHLPALRGLVGELDRLGAAHLILHELFVSPENLDAMRGRRYRQDEARAGDKLRWSGVAASDAAALQLLLHGLEAASRLSLYYCSTATQQWIAENALARSVEKAPRS